MEQTKHGLYKVLPKLRFATTCLMVEKKVSSIDIPNPSDGFSMVK